jgi:hypothetical protein
MFTIVPSATFKLTSTTDFYAEGVDTPFLTTIDSAIHWAIVLAKIGRKVEAEDILTQLLVGISWYAWEQNVDVKMVTNAGILVGVTDNLIELRALNDRVVQECASRLKERNAAVSAQQQATMRAVRRIILITFSAILVFLVREWRDRALACPSGSAHRMWAEYICRVCSFCWALLQGKGAEGEEQEAERQANKRERKRQGKRAEKANRENGRGNREGAGRESRRDAKEQARRQKEESKTMAEEQAEKRKVEQAKKGADKQARREEGEATKRVKGERQIVEAAKKAKRAKKREKEEKEQERRGEEKRGRERVAQAREEARRKEEQKIATTKAKQEAVAARQLKVKQEAEAKTAKQKEAEKSTWTHAEAVAAIETSSSGRSLLGISPSSPVRSPGVRTIASPSSPRRVGSLTVFTNMVLGEGSNGTKVYRGKHADGRAVAVKVMLKEAVPEHRARREMQLLQVGDLL